MRVRPLMPVLLPLLVAGCARPAMPSRPAERYDLLITGGLVIDGTGAPASPADVAVRGDRIVRVSTERLPRTSAARVIDAAGKVVAPGFIDLHAHVERLLELPAAENFVRQGVTTLLGSPDGGSTPGPTRPYLDSVGRAPLAVNVAYYVGHNTVRREVLGMADRAPTAAELDSMRVRVARGMGEGAYGLSTGLAYVPGAFAETDEIVALARVAADSGGIYTSHVRSEGTGLAASVAEAIEIGRRARIPIVLDHHKALGHRVWGASVRTLAMVDSARASGVDVMLNQYPYAASSTGLSQLVPAWALAGGDAALRRRLASPRLRDSVTRGILDVILNERGGGDLRRIQLAQVTWGPELEGKTLHDWAVIRGLAPTPEAGAELVIEAMQRGGASAIYHLMDEGDVERIMRHPQTMIASDGQLTAPGDAQPHPRAYGTYPRVLGHYVRERRVLSLEAAVRKMTAMPAARLGLRDRGLVAEAGYADLVVFDAATVTDRATYEAPHQYPEGIDYVVVNGVVTVDGGRRTAAHGGRLLRHRAAR